MFKNVEARYILRCVLVGLAAAVSSISSGGSWRDIVVAGFGGALAYAGIGAAVPAVEPWHGQGAVESGVERHRDDHGMNPQRW